MYNTPPPYSPYPNAMPPPPRRSGNGWLIGLGGCGAIVLLLVIWGATALNKTMKGGIGRAVQQMQDAQTCGYNLLNVRAALDKYRAAHGGKYPAALSELMPLYLADKSAIGCGAMTTEYTPPKPNAPGSASVLIYRGDEAGLMSVASKRTGGAAQISHFDEVRLLKDGRVVTDSITRTEIGGATSGNAAP